MKYFEKATAACRFFHCIPILLGQYCLKGVVNLRPLSGHLNSKGERQ